MFVLVVVVGIVMVHCQCVYLVGGWRLMLNVYRDLVMVMDERMGCNIVIHTWFVSWTGPVSSCEL